jgi:hypothetical protein
MAFEYQLKLVQGAAAAKASIACLLPTRLMTSGGKVNPSMPR